MSLDENDDFPTFEDLPANMNHEGDWSYVLRYLFMDESLDQATYYKMWLDQGLELALGNCDHATVWINAYESQHIVQSRYQKGNGY